MDNKFNSILSVALIPQTVALIIKNDNFSEFDALNKFYQSKVYELLSKEETKMWHYSSKALCQYYLLEQEGCLVVTEGL